MKILSLCVFTYFLSASVNALMVDFENGLDSQFSYDRVFVYQPNAGPINSGYEQMGLYTGSKAWAINPFGKSASTFWWEGDNTFDLTSFAIAGAWGSQTLSIEGLLNNTVVNSQALAVDNSGVTLFEADWLGVDSFRITIGDDFTLGDDFALGSGFGQQWVLDNVIINESQIAVAEPTNLLLLGLGFILIGIATRRKLC